MFKIPRKRTIKNPSRVFSGIQSRIKGKGGENHFINCCKVEGIKFFQIHDGERVNKFIRKPQPCDFIIILSGKAWLLDTKNRNRASRIRSLFIPQNSLAKPTSTQNQTSGFIEAYMRGFRRSGFLFRKGRFNDGWLFLSTESLMKSVRNTPLTFLDIENIRDLDEQNKEE